jgi:transcriptional regulator with XRE-family HTH domain
MAETDSTYPLVDYPEPLWTLGERIRKCRTLMDLEQGEFGALLNPIVSGSLVSKWEKDHREPKLSQLRQIENFAPVPKGFLIRSRCASLRGLRVIPGGSKGPEKISQPTLPFLTLCADN